MSCNVNCMLMLEIINIFFMDYIPTQLLQCSYGNNVGHDRVKVFPSNNDDDFVINTNNS